MMVKTEQGSLNTLRVASKEWPGLVYYQGVTSRTTLSTAEKATQTTPTAKNKASKNIASFRTKSISVNGCTNHEKSERGTSPIQSKTKEPNYASIFGEPDKDITYTKSVNCLKQTRLSNQRSVPASTSRDASIPSDEVNKNRRSVNADKTLLPLPNVSWNEMPRLDQGSSSTSGLPKNNPWFSNQRIPRPHTAGPRVIVPLKHTCPVGLNKEDIIRGTRLRDQNATQEDISSTKQPNDTDISISTTSRKSFDRRHIKEETHKRLCKLTKHKEHETKLTALELTITPIQPEQSINFSNSENNFNDPDTLDKDDDIPESNDVTNNSSPLINSYNLNTMEGIRKSYRRAQSAPPTHHRYEKVQSVTSDIQTNTKQFSNLYWRAKSAYHKRLEATSEEEPDDSSKEDHKTLCHTSNTKHTLLRPLLRADDGEIKHSAGCPYKCKGCFKACLVSDDYVQKAIAKAVEESENPIETKTEKSRPYRLVGKTDIINQALGKSQPLFHQVYGGGKVRGRIKIRPWPKYGWMDLKMKKAESKIPEDSKLQYCESVNGKSTTGSDISEEK